MRSRESGESTLGLDFVDVCLCNLTTLATMVVAQSANFAVKLVLLLFTCVAGKFRLHRRPLTSYDHLPQRQTHRRMQVDGKYRRRRILLEWPKIVVSISNFTFACRISISLSRSSTGGRWKRQTGSSACLLTEA